MYEDKMQRIEEEIQELKKYIKEHKKEIKKREKILSMVVDNDIEVEIQLYKEEIEKFKEQLKIRKQLLKNYKNIGLGVFGYANMLFMLRIKYGSEEAKIFTDALFNFMFRTAVIEDSILAEELGAFPKFNKKVWDSTIIKKHFSPKELEDLRN